MAGRYALGMLFIILVSFALGAYFYPLMPESMPSHWNASGQVDGYMPKLWGLFLMPLISLGMLGLFLAIPGIDPKRKNIEMFRAYYDRFVLIIIGFLFYLYVLTLLWPLGYTFNMIAALVPAFSLIFYYAGVLVQNAKQNWFIGIRTPWTLSSERVWDRTHKLGGNLFKASALIGLLGLLVQDYAIWLILIPVIVTAIYTVAYSYFEFRKEERKKDNTHPFRRRKV
jgi:uncharacterized membrane protein